MEEGEKEMKAVIGIASFLWRIGKPLVILSLIVLALSRMLVSSETRMHKRMFWAGMLAAASGAIALTGLLIDALLEAAGFLSAEELALMRKELPDVESWAAFALILSAFLDFVAVWWLSAALRDVPYLKSPAVLDLQEVELTEESDEGTITYYLLGKDREGKRQKFCLSVGEYDAWREILKLRGKENFTVQAEYLPHTKRILSLKLPDIA